MKVRLLGTGAADGIPALFSKDEISRFAREYGGRDVRTRSAAIIDDQLKIDLGPDTLHQMTREGLSAADWIGLVFTHSHEDHLTVSELQYALYPFTPDEENGFCIYGNASVLEAIRTRYPDWPFELHLSASFEPFRLAEYEITPVKAFHVCAQEDAQNLLITRDGRTLLYATDTGVWRDETWEFLLRQKIHGLVIECTDGLAPTTYDGHLDCKEAIEVVAKLRDRGALESEAPVYTTHHAHYGMATHEQLRERLEPHGILPGYDGLIFEI
jgi:phosphoribosyl 1,2-cyclic phosphate phosphodiesterase